MPGGAGMAKRHCVVYTDPAVVLYEDQSLAKPMGGCFVQEIKLTGNDKAVVKGTSPDQWGSPRPVTITLKFSSPIAATQWNRKTTALIK